MARRRYVVRRERTRRWIVWNTVHNGPVAAVYKRRSQAHRAAIHLSQIDRGERYLVQLEDGRYALKTPIALLVRRPFAG